MTSPIGSSAAAPASPPHVAPPEDVIVDRRILDLIREYLKASRGELHVIQDDLVRIRVAPADARFFNNRLDHTLALSVTAMQRHPESELPVIGSAFWNSLLRAIRERGHRRVRGCLPISVTSPPSTPEFRIEGATAELLDCVREQRRLLRLSTRLTLAAGTTVEEELVESDVIDLTSGTRIGPWIADQWTLGSHNGEIAAAENSTTTDIVPALVAGIEQRVAERLQSLQQEADRALKEEFARIDRYYAAVRQELREDRGPGTAGEAAIEREHAKRRAEETRRYQLRIDVEPVQVEECTVVAERARWRLTSPVGRSAELMAHRYLSGPGDWEIRCPCCRASPEAVTVCRAGHAAGVECINHCTVCNDAFCTEHGHSSCAVDGKPVCSEHGSICFSCERVHCTAHQATCTETGHIGCSDCVHACESCGRMICRRHGNSTRPDAPRGERFLCKDCITWCEGSTSEPVGVDESALCFTCGKHICLRHQVLCEVDRKPHCSKHLRRADRSRRFICEQHRADCAREPGVIFASDEVITCVKCGTACCARHSASCLDDQAWYCDEHVSALTDVQAFACEEHQSRCHIDDRVFSLRGTLRCEICGKNTCRTHRRRCAICGAEICQKDLAKGSDRCVSCSQLKSTTDVPHEVVSAAMRLVEPGSIKRWDIARDGGRYVVDLHLGWTRHIVFTVPHGGAEPLRARRISLLGSTPIK
jgi:hypothetical protein